MARSRSLLELDDTLITLALSRASVGEIGRVASTCRRLRRLAAPSLLMREQWAAILDWAAPPSSRLINPPVVGGAAALAVANDAVLFADGDHLLLAPVPADPATVAPPPLTAKHSHTNWR